MTLSQAESTSRARRDPEGTRRAILEAAVEEFSDHGLLGGRIDAIAERTSTTKRMIYYYFRSKEDLYTAALVESYRRIRDAESSLHLDELDPEQALRVLVRSNVLHHEQQPAFVRLVVFENLLPEGSVHLMSEEARETNRRAVELVDDILRRGRAAGVFRTGPDAPTALDVQQVISGLAFQRVSNRSTFNQLFGRDMLSEVESPRIRRMIEDVVLRFVLAD
ncbi:TetR/AcrR family transcriptional regulator [Cellulomonas taurus]|uniref:TetR/AcrR family transcriptional regulator n=1 Tax=Cellulomonas taurus TaxID=2729175 RepID=UPI00145D9A66|nr:TetR/AcrR family transcriptional regulator [Cellulomonas taurus]